MHYNARNESRLVDTTGRPVRIETNRWLFISPLALAFAFSRAIDWTMDTHTDRLHFRCIFIFVLSFGDIRRIFQNNILKMAKAISKRTFQVNDIVFAKIRGFPDWPSLIKKIDGNIVTVQFFSELKEVYV